MTIEVAARPGSHQRGILRVEPRGLVVGIASPAEKGKANDELIAIIAKLAEVPRGEIAIVRGASSRNKVLRIASREPLVIAHRILIAASKAK